MLLQSFLICLLCVGMSAAQAVPASGAPERTKNVLLLYSYGHGGKGIAVFDDSLVEALSRGGVNSTNLFFEYLDLERNRDDPQYPSQLKQGLQRKYDLHHIDAILTVQQPALAWLLTEGQQIAPQAPVVSVQAPAPSLSALGTRHLVSALTEFDVRGTIEQALRLFPNTQRVVVVAGNSESDQQMALDARRIAQSLNKALTIESTVGMPLDRMLDRLATLPEKSIILFTQYNRDIDGHAMTAYEVEGLVVRKANAPVFGLYDFNLINGGIGGSVVSVTGLGEKAGRLLLDVLSGTTKLTEPLTIVDAGVVPMFDWAQINRWNADPSMLPADTVFVNRTPGFWEQYGNVALGVAIFILAESFLILALLISRRRRSLAEQATRDSDRKLRMITSSTQDALLMIDHEGKAIFWNAAAEAMFGYSEQEALGKDIHALLAPSQSRERYAASLRRFQQAGEGGAIGKTVRYTARRRSGEEFPVELSLSAVKVGDRWNAVGVVHDISARKRIEDELRHLTLTVEQSPESIVITDMDAKIEYVNNAFVGISGYSREEALGKNPRIMQSGKTPTETYKSLWESLTQGRTWKGELYNRRKDGSEYIELATITPLRNESGTIVKYVAVKEDITARKSAEADALHLAFYDYLTNLPNRRLLLDRLDKALSASARNGKFGALIFIDLDNFKTLNDTLGHDVGDQLLRQVGMRLLGCVRASDTVARFGGDEFVVMIEDLDETLTSSMGQADIVGNKILNSICMPFELDKYSHSNSASIGIAMFFGHEEGSEELLKRADIAMYSAKESGRNAVRFFDAYMKEVVNAQASTELDLRRALSQNQFELYFQPKIDSGGGITGAETLLRLNHPQNGIVTPDSFISIAERSGLILEIGRWVLSSACSQLARWSEDPKLAQLTLAINVSARQFSEPNFVQDVLDTLKRSGGNPKLLVLELTESMLVGNYESVIEKMTVLRGIGIRFALDDFGTGYSSLSYLNRLPLDQLKIDRSFVESIPDDVSACAIVRTVIALGKTLHLRVIAEGVETKEQLEFLKDNGCNLYQGYLLSRPLPLGEFVAFAKSVHLSVANVSPIGVTQRIETTIALHRRVTKPAGTKM